MSVVQIQARAENWVNISIASIDNSTITCKLTLCCRWDNKTARERTDHLLSYARICKWTR